MSVPLLSVKALRKRYGALKVTDGVNLDVLPGELHAIIGPNGAGKTTLVHQISGLVASDSGEILFAGQDVRSLSMSQRARSGLSRSFQITSVLQNLSALENVAIAIQAVSGSSFRFFANAARDETLNAPARALLEKFALDHRAHVIAGNLSYGEKRQLELAISLAIRPKALLLDEPLAGTSHEEAARVIDTIRTLKGEIAILLIEHDMDAVFSLADRVSVLVYGQVIACGTPAEIRAHAGVRAAYLGEEAA